MCSECLVCDNAHEVPWKRCGCTECDDGICDPECCQPDCRCRATFKADLYDPAVGGYVYHPPEV